MTDIKALIEKAKIAAKTAGEAILEIYNSEDFGVEAKEDQSPLTKADKAAHEIIIKELASTGLPVLSEEGKKLSYDQRKSWDIFWMIDPLDGTKEFIKKNGEFTVNIALIENDLPIAGVVYAPVLDWLYWSLPEKGAFKKEKNEAPKSIGVNTYNMQDKGLTVVASRSHLNDDTQSFIDQLHEPALTSMGSSLKLLLVAEGKADIYPRYAPTMEWDTAAADAVVRASGGKVLKPDMETSLTYNKEDLLNPHFIVIGNC